jgi:low affinity Fe/Cu permease
MTVCRKGPSLRVIFRSFAQATSRRAGSGWAFSLAVLVVLVWLLTGPLFRFSDSWQLVINTGTTIVTFLMVFLLQNTQNRESKAIQLKLDELIRAVKNARNTMIHLEHLSDEEIEKLEKQSQMFRGRRERRARKEPQLPGDQRPGPASGSAGD